MNDVGYDGVMMVMIALHSVGSNIGGFRIMDDSQVVLSEPGSAIHAYIHYFSLCDLQARGFVRPVTTLSLPQPFPPFSPPPPL